MDRPGRRPQQVRSGRPAQLAIDTTNLQFFDPGSGLAVTSG
jgi:hypothetical protein